jgi:hypothetical protein
MSHDLSGYEEVPDRIARFIATYPEGRLTGTHKIIEVGGNTFVEYVAFAHRSDTDEVPGRGVTWEPYPGRTPYTKDSEVENAETSAWGRALAAIGFTGKKIATAEEVANAQARRGEDTGRPNPARSGTRSAGKPSDAQRSFLRKLLTEKKPSLDQLAVILREVGADGVDPNATGWSEKLTAGKEGTASLLITYLKEKPLPSVEHPSDVPSDGFEETFPAVREGEEVPFS